MFEIFNRVQNPNSHQAQLEEALKKKEIIRVLRALGAAHITPLIYKGTALAYRDYKNAHERPRCDTDLLIETTQRADAFNIFMGLGYQPVLTSDIDFVSHQFAFTFFDQFNIHHVFDVHWHISNRELFKNLFTYDELYARAESLPRLCPEAKAFSKIDSLLIACIHPVMHHHNCEDSQWIHDISLLALKMSDENWNIIIGLAKEKKVAKILYRGLQLSHKYHPESVPKNTLYRLEKFKNTEPTEVFLQGDMSEAKIMIIDFKAMPDFKTKNKFISAVIFPSKAYMLSKYNWNHSRLKIFWPVLYLRRIFSRMVAHIKLKLLLKSLP